MFIAAPTMLSCLYISSARLRGACWMLLWAFLFSFLGVCMKKLGPLPNQLVVLARTAIQFAILVPWIPIKKIKPPQRKDWKWFVIRLVIGYPAMLITYFVYHRLPLSIASSIGFIEPSIQILLSMCVTNLSMTWDKWSLVIIGYGGVLLMNYPISSGQWFIIGLAFLANLLSSIAKLITKHIAGSYSSLQLLIYGNLTFLPITLLGMLSLGPISKESLMTLQEADISYYVGLILLTSLCSLGSHYAYTKALQEANFDLIGPMTYLRLLFAIPLGMIFFEEELSLYKFLGASLIVVSNYILVMKKKDRSKNSIPSVSSS